MLACLPYPLQLQRPRRACWTLCLPASTLHLAFHAGAGDGGWVVAAYPAAATACFAVLAIAAFSHLGLCGIWWAMFTYYGTLLLVLGARYTIPRLRARL